jgi:xanthine dehydrogenase molybdopterin-binding subunit B
MHKCVLLLHKIVVVSHTGTEVGQGINTKVAQAVAYGLGIDMKNIVIGSASTDKVPNSSDTGGSGTSECAVASAIQACSSLNAALAPIKV